MADQNISKHLEGEKPLAFSTPVNKFNTSRSRPLPIFTDYHENKLFHFKRSKPFNDRTLHPRSPIKSAPPISRVFPHRNWAPQKPHAVSFLAGDDQSVDSALCSRFYNSECSELYFEQCFIIVKKLGEGSFGEVMQVRSRDNQQEYAVKRSREKFKSESDRRRKLDEVKKHEKLPEHPNCVKFIKAWEEKQRLYIQTELCKMSLQTYCENNQNIPLYFVWQYFIDLLHGLQHIHKHGFIHFDVKPANIFISVEGTCKIGDFGLVVDQSNDNIEEAREGDNKYMAPELLVGLFSEKADVFSLGIAILEITCDLDLPSGGDSWHLLRQGYIPEECVKQMPSTLLQIVRWMMTPDYTKRPTITEVLEHSIIITYKRKLKFNSFFERICCKICHCLWFLVLLLIHAIFFPLKKLKCSSVQCFANATQHNTCVEVKEWDSSLSSHHSLSNNSENNMLNFVNDSNKDHLFITPESHGLRFTPTPRNSSPLAHRSAVTARRSPDISPLSHRGRLFKENLSTHKRSPFVDDFDFFISDHSDSEHSEKEEVQDRILPSRPRNLLEMLNEVSDSDHSNVALCDTEEKE